MKMKIVYFYPPNIKEISEKFKLRKTVVFTYGNIIYNPGRGKITDDLKVHESTHMRQQAKGPWYGPELWWKEYLKNPAFRLDQEVEAYRNQLIYFKSKNHDVRKVLAFKDKLARDLSSEIYGNLVHYQTADRLIKNGFSY